MVNRGFVPEPRLSRGARRPQDIVGCHALAGSAVLVRVRSRRVGRHLVRARPSRDGEGQRLGRRSRRSISSRRRRCRPAACRIRRRSRCSCATIICSYALTWFGLAAVLVVMFAIWALRAARGEWPRTRRPPRLAWCKTPELITVGCTAFPAKSGNSSDIKPEFANSTPAMTSAASGFKDRSCATFRPAARPRRSASSMSRSRASPATADSMCPKPGRGSRRQTIAGFAGRPYAEVAVEVIRPFVGDAISEADLSRLAREAYGTFRHPAVAPLVPVRRQHLPARAVPRPDARVQGRRHAVPGAADGSRAGGARRAHHHRGRDLRRHRRRRGRGVPRPRADRPVRAVSEGPRFRRAAPDDDDRAGRQRACARGRRHVRRLPGAGEGPVQPSRLPRPGAAVGRQLDQLGAHRRAGGLLLHRRGDARRAASQGRLHRADRKFRRHLRGLCRRSAWACRSTGW